MYTQFAYVKLSHVVHPSFRPEETLHITFHRYPQMALGKIFLKLANHKQKLPKGFRIEDFLNRLTRDKNRSRRLCQLTDLSETSNPH